MPKDQRENIKKAVKKYQQKCDAIMLRPSKEDGAKIREAAANIGMSVQSFVVSTMLERIEKEQLLKPKEDGL